MNRGLLITGASGFIGSMLLKQLSNSDWPIIPVVRKARGFKNEIVIDFCAPNFTTAINTLPKVSTIIHLGASVGCDGKTREVLFEPNVLATAELANWAYKNNVYFIFASTIMVCGVKNSYITSESKPNPDTDYGYSKWLAEEIIKISGVKHAILRISGVFGKGGPHHLGINKSINDALNGLIPIQFGYGSIKRNYIFVKDLCSMLNFCCENKVEGTHFVAGSYINTISEMLKIICDVFLSGKQPTHHDGNFSQDQVVECSTTFPKTRSFSEAIEDIKKDERSTRI